MSGHGLDLVQSIWIGLAHLSFQVSGSQLVLLKSAWVCSSSVGSQLCPVHSVHWSRWGEVCLQSSVCVTKQWAGWEVTKQRDWISLEVSEERFLSLWYSVNYLLFSLSLLPETWVITNSPRLTPAVLRTWRIFRKCKCSPKPTGWRAERSGVQGGESFRIILFPLSWASDLSL